MIHRIENLVERIDGKAIVLDSITALFSPRPPEHLLRAHFLHLVQTFRRLDLTSIILAEGAATPEQLTDLPATGI